MELSFDIQGIYGFVIGTTFKINKGFLPPKYDNFAYIITGISHSIQDNKWITSVKTQFFPDRSPQKVEPFRLTHSAAGVSAQQQAQLAVSQPELTEVILNDPAPIINPNKIGGDRENGYRLSPVWNDIISKGQRNGLMDQKNTQVLVFIGETKGANRLYINPATGSPEYMLHPDAAAAWFKWRDEMIAKGVPYTVSSGYRSQRQQAGIAGGRTVAKPGRSAHGVGGALDFKNLYRLVGGKDDPKINLEQGRKTGDYKQLAEIGAKYNWYNPWRLSDNSGVDECWHFEYWGPVKMVASVAQGLQVQGLPQSVDRISERLIIQYLGQEKFNTFLKEAKEKGLTLAAGVDKRRNVAEGIARSNSKPDINGTVTLTSRTVDSKTMKTSDGQYLVIKFMKITIQ